MLSENQQSATPHRELIPMPGHVVKRVEPDIRVVNRVGDDGWPAPLTVFRMTDSRSICRGTQMPATRGCGMCCPRTCSWRPEIESSRVPNVGDRMFARTTQVPYARTHDMRTVGYAKVYSGLQLHVRGQHIRNLSWPHLSSSHRSISVIRKHRERGRRSHRRRLDYDRMSVQHV